MRLSTLSKKCLGLDEVRKGFDQGRRKGSTPERILQLEWTEWFLFISKGQTYDFVSNH